MSYMASQVDFFEAVMAERVVSSGECPGDNSRPARMDPARLHKAFPAQWSAWLLKNRFDQRTISAAFGVDDRTARNWLAGISAPRAHHVVRLEVTRPGTLREIIGMEEFV